MRPLKRKRWVLILPGLVLVLLLGLWLCVPLWLPWMLGPLAKHFGVHYDGFRRQSYNRFELHGVSITNGGVVITAETVNALIPSTWFWRAKAVHSDTPQPFVTSTNWTLDILDIPRSSPAQKSTFTNVTEITRTLASLQDWLPSASLVDGRIQLRHRTLLVPMLSWSNGLFTATARTVQP